MYKCYYNDELYHYGVKGMKWGVRKVRDSEGNLTRFGKRRDKKLNKKADKLRDKEIRRARFARSVGRLIKDEGKADKEYKAERERIDKIDKIRRKEIAKDSDFYENSSKRTAIKTLPFEAASIFLTGFAGIATSVGQLGNAIQYQNKSNEFLQARRRATHEYKTKIADIDYEFNKRNIIDTDWL